MTSEESIKNDCNIKESIRKLINSDYTVIALALLIFIFWALDFPYISVSVLAIFEGCVFYFCSDNPKSFIFPIIACPYMITTFLNGARWILFGICIGIFLSSIITYVILQKFKYKKDDFKKGKMFWAFVLAAIGNCLGGIIGHWDFLVFFLVFLFSLIIYGFYWFILNFVSSKDKKYFIYCLMVVCFLIIAEMILSYIRVGDFASAIHNKLVFIGTGEINTAGIFLLMGVCASFYYAYESKRDYLYILLALLFDIAIFFTFSRMAILIAAVLSIAGFIIVVRKSVNKKNILIFCLATLGFVLLFASIFFEKVSSLFSYYISLGIKPNGRDGLWPWCLEQFLQNPIFGISYVTRDANAVAGAYSGLYIIGDQAIVACHNFFLHYLTCTGIVGLLLNIPFYIKKYILLFKSFDKFKMFCLLYFISMFVSSLFDPSPNLSPFNVIISVVLIAFMEKDNEEKGKEKSNG